MAEEPKTYILTRLAAEGAVALAGVALVAWAVRADDAWFQLHLMPAYCATKASSLARAHALRAVVAVAGTVLVFVVRPRVGTRAARRTPLAGALLALQLVVAIGLAFVATDLVLRAVRAARPPDAPPPLVLAHRSKESAIVDTAGRPVHYAINSDGLRTRTVDDVLDYDAPTVLFEGESVALGYGLEYDETIPARVGAALGIQTANLAISGQGSDAALLRLRALLPRFTRPVAVVTFVVFNLLYRNVERDRAHLVLDDDGALVLAPAAEAGWLTDSPLAAALRTLYHPEDAVQLTRAVLRETDAFTRARGAKPIFLFTQCGERRCVATGPEGPWLEGRLREGLALDALDVELDPAQLQPKDIHPTARGAEPFVRALVAALRRTGIGQ